MSVIVAVSQEIVGLFIAVELSKIFLGEIIIRTKPSSSSKFYYLWSVVDKLRIGAIYAIILEAFKLGS